MNQDFLLQHFEILQKGLDKDIFSISSCSEEVKKGALFVAIKGQMDDGHRYLNQACQKGARFLLVQEDSSVPPSFTGTVARTADTLKALSQLLNEFYDHVSQKLFVVGVTGTNGKTTTACLTEHIFNHCGWPTGLIGTIERRFKDRAWPARLTTPDPVELFQRLKDFFDLSAKAVVMEVSSIALDQRRTEGVDFNVGVFTNLTRDHLDYHLNFENYFSAKKNLFRKMENLDNNHFVSLINEDDDFGRRLLKELRGRRYTFGERDSADFSFTIKSQDLFHTLFTIQSPDDFSEGEIALAGRHNMYNVAGAVAVAATAGFSLSDCVKSLKSFSGVSGRLEKITSRQHPFHVFVDYAHTPSALQQVLRSLNSFQSTAGRVVTIFGCGGNRDREKRGEMAQVAARLSHRVFLTSDNPRHEEPNAIIEDCLRSLSQKDRGKFVVEPDRHAAIQKAIQEAGKGDFLLIAGKGHETVQIIGDKRFPFDDRKVAKAFLSGSLGFEGEN